MKQIEFAVGLPQSGRVPQEVRRLGAGLPVQERAGLRLLQQPATPPKDTPPPFQPVPVKPPARPSGQKPPPKGSRRRLFLPWPLPTLLAVLAVLDLVAGAVLYELVHRVGECGGRVCSLVTHGHPQLTMSLAIGSSVALVGTALAPKCFRDAEWR